MNNTNYSQSGNYIAIAGVIAMILTHFGIIADPTSIVTVIVGAVALFGIVKQFLDHKALAVSAGAIQK